MGGATFTGDDVRYPVDKISNLLARLSVADDIDEKTIAGNTSTDTHTKATVVAEATILDATVTQHTFTDLSYQNEHVPGTANVRADTLSRLLFDNPNDRIEGLEDENFTQKAAEEDSITKESAAAAAIAAYRDADEFVNNGQSSWESC
jgi:hypothetical protein